MNLLKKNELFYDTTWQSSEPHQQEMGTTDLCASIPIDIDSFVSNLPNLDELEAHSSQHDKPIEPYMQLNNNQHVYHDLNMFSLEQHNFEVHLSETTRINRLPVYLGEPGNRIDSNICFGNEKSTDLMHKMDILNQIISDESGAPSTYSTEQNKHFLSTQQSTNYFSGSFNTACDFNFNLELPDSKRKLKSKIVAKTKCSVCGNESSGYHYGSHTCEACKLFFRRTEKRMRKTGFTECQKKNCQITTESRANCSQCRYKKCIAAGMSMSRSRYGRHTERETSAYLPNITESLCLMVEQLKESLTKKLLTLGFLNELILDFYSKVLKLLNIFTDETANNRPPYSYEYSSNQTPLPNCVLVLFCVLFNLNTGPIKESFLHDILIDYENFLCFIKRNILLNNEFVPMLKIGLFVKSMRVLFEAEPCKEDHIDKRITDLMRSEFALFKFNSNDSSTLALLSSQMNHILFKHMTQHELDQFLFKKCFTKFV